MMDLDFDFERLKTFITEESFEKLLTDIFVGNIQRQRLSRLRSLYIFFIMCKCRLADISLDLTPFFDTVDNIAGHLPLNECTLYKDLAEIYARLATFNKSKIFKVLERMTRGQSANILWFLLRDKIITGSTLEPFIRTQILRTSMSDLTTTLTPWLVFGKRHEPVVKNILETLIIKAPEPVPGGLGLLLEPNSGIFGASLDLCYGIHEDQDNLVFSDKIQIYEIKCKCGLLYDSLDQGIQAFLKAPSKEAFVDIIKEATFPLIEFRPDGQNPSSGTYLISHDPCFDIKRKRRLIYESSDFVRRLLIHNQNVQSTVWVLDVTETPDDLTVKLIANFSVRAFFNFRHRYYHQILTQYFVTTQLYIEDHPCPEGISPDNLPTVHIVTALFRTNTKHLDIRVNETQYKECEIPFLIIITPVRLLVDCVASTIRVAAFAYKQKLKRETGIEIWESDFLSGFISSHVVRPPTP